MNLNHRTRLKTFLWNNNDNYIAVVAEDINNAKERLFRYVSKKSTLFERIGKLIEQEPVVETNDGLIVLLSSFHEDYFYRAYHSLVVLYIGERYEPKKKKLTYK